MPRFAVLHDLDDERTPPVGIALEMPDHVLVHAPSDFGIPQRHDGEYRVLSPELVYVTYQPGDAGYFEQVLGSLSTTFAIGEHGTVRCADDETLLKLIVRKIDGPQQRVQVGEYDVALTFAREAAGRDHIRALYDQHSAYHAEPDEELLVAARGGIVAA